MFLMIHGPRMGANGITSKVSRLFFDQHQDNFTQLEKLAKNQCEPEGLDLDGENRRSQIDR